MPHFLVKIGHITQFVRQWNIKLLILYLFICWHGKCYIRNARHDSCYLQ